MSGTHLAADDRNHNLTVFSLDANSRGGQSRLAWLLRDVSATRIFLCFHPSILGGRLSSSQRGQEAGVGMRPRQGMQRALDLPSGDLSPRPTLGHLGGKSHPSPGLFLTCRLCELNYFISFI